MAKYNNDGAVIWGQVFDSGGTVEVSDIASDGSSVFIAGYFDSVITIDGFDFETGGGEDFFVAVLDDGGLIPTQELSAAPTTNVLSP